MPVATNTAEDEFAAIHAAAAADRAGAALETLRGGLRHPAVLTEVFKALHAEGRPRITAADTAVVLARYAGLLGRGGHLDDARAAFDASIAVDPNDYVARIEAGTVAFMRADLGAAEAHYRVASDLRPAEAEPLAARAAIAARQSQPAQAQALGAQALAIDPQHVTAALAVARADLLLGAADAAVVRLDTLLARPDLPVQNRVAALDLRADAHDAGNRCAAAFADYGARNALLHAANAPRIARELPERRITQARRLARWFATADPAPWAQRAGNAGATEAAGHAFLIGFPRSGTTLLEKALAGHPAVISIEEHDHLSAVTPGWLDSDAALQRLATLDAATADAARGDYWRRVGASVPGGIAGRTIVDKLPLHSVALPVIAKLFPDARILLALRDPRDVVLSCFRRRFQINAAMFEFLTLAGAADYYDQVMQIVQHCRLRLPLAVHTVRHEALVRDFEGEIGAALAALGLGWDAATRNFAARIGVRFRTPSDIQLTRGLSDAGIGQWRRYADQLAPVMPVLAPWVSAFGYDAAG
ncbi:MAG: sulfotransferase [Polymorphobacter sp.]